MRELVNNDLFLERLGSYFEFHKIKDTFVLTFSDFIECVISGRWEEMMKNKTTVFEEVKENHVGFKFYVDEALGYVVQIDNSRKVFGSKKDSRERATSFLEQLKG